MTIIFLVDILTRKKHSTCRNGQILSSSWPIPAENALSDASHRLPAMAKVSVEIMIKMYNLRKLR